MDKNKIIKFGSDTKYRKQWFTGISFSHPAKLSLPLQLWLIDNFTKEGETILDPMAGSGTVLVACSMGRNVIAVDLEQKFVDIMKGNWEKIKQRGPQLGYQMGIVTILRGDARNLTGILADKIVTSPPYAENKLTGDDAQSLLEAEKHFGRKFGKSYRSEALVDKIITSPPYAEAKLGIPEFELVTNKFHRKSGEKSPSELAMYHSENPDNVSNLPYGSIDKIITSPPYAETNPGLPTTFDKKRWLIFQKAKYKNHYKEKISEEALERMWQLLLRYSEKLESNNIANLPYGSIDISSPPYEEAMGKKHHSPRADKLAKEKTLPQSYTGKIDAVISSPPYEHQVHGRTTLKPLTDNPSELGNLMPEGYSPNQNNIGNLKSDSYLSAMLQVYQQCYAILKDGGLMVLVVKSFIRNRKIVDLAADTICLCETAGFTFQDRWYRELANQSFWRTIYKQRYPDAPTIDFEDILIFGKARE